MTTLTRADLLSSESVRVTWTTWAGPTTATVRLGRQHLAVTGLDGHTEAWPVYGWDHLDTMIRRFQVTS